MQDFETISDQELLPYIQAHITNPLIQKVIGNLLQYYMKTATLCRRYYYISAALTIVLPTLVTIVSSLAGVWNMTFINIFTAIVAGMSAIISGFNSLFKWQENWLRYRMGVEQLKKESINYIAGVDIYQDQTNKDILFLDKMQRLTEDMNTKDIIYYGSIKPMQTQDVTSSESETNSTKDN